MNDDIESILNGIANVLAQDADYPLDGTFLYVEADTGWVDISIFKDLGDHLVARWPMRGLSTILLELWEAVARDRRWSTMQYRIDNGKFVASFTHEPLDAEQPTWERREIILQQRYGNKRIEYPPLS